MTVTAEVFLCPAIELLSSWLKLPPDIAGVTLFAFASGAPDLFTQIAALAQGEHVDLDLAVSATFGGGMFIICVVFAAVILVDANSEHIDIPDARAYVRDIVAYMVATVFTLVILWRGTLTVWDGAALLFGYLLYLAVCVLTTRGRAVGGGVPLGTHHPARGSYAISGYSPVKTTVETTSSEVTKAQRPLVGIELMSRGAAVPGTAVANRDNGVDGGGIKPLAFDIEDGPATLHTHQHGWLFKVKKGVHCLLDDYLHLHSRKGWRLWFSYATAPLILCMHATMPAVTSGVYTRIYGVVVSIVAPFFFLVSLYLGPQELGAASFLVFWCLGAAGLFALIHLAVLPGAPPQGIPTLQSPRHLHGPGLNVIKQSSSIWTVRPRRNVPCACIALVGSIVWMNSAADEVVALFQAIGRIWDIGQGLLGATALSWGQTVPDLVAVISLAKAGQGTMAIAACFGGPVFNLLASMGGPILYAAARSSAPLEYTLDAGTLLLAGATVGVLIFLLVAVPFCCGWKLPRMVGVIVLLFYVALILLLVVAEEEWVFPSTSGGD